MHRRAFLTLAAALPFLAGPARAAQTLDYTPGNAEALMDEGRVILLDFKADWCSTCAAQERVIGALRADNPAYDTAIAFVNVDWDAHGKGELSRGLQIPRRSTLVLLQGRRELARIVAGTGRDEIKALLDKGLAAAGA
jgi:thiol-disulfide isomerase/thioredoxin